MRHSLVLTAVLLAACSASDPPGFPAYGDGPPRDGLALDRVAAPDAAGDLTLPDASSADFRRAEPRQVCNRETCAAHAGYACWVFDGDASSSSHCCERGDGAALHCLD